jgi:hypothetical protein
MLFIRILFIISFLNPDPGIKDRIREGDIVFQWGDQPFSRAIRMATGSEFSHVGLVLKRNGALYVLEAVYPVKYTSLDEWIRQGAGGKVYVKRLREAEKFLTEQNLLRLKEEGERHLGKEYDIKFGSSDERMYCSELVWKIYDRALGVRLGEWKKLKEYRLDDTLVRQQLFLIHGENPPYEELMISPGNIYKSDLLRDVQ